MSRLSFLLFNLLFLSVSCGEETTSQDDPCGFTVSGMWPLEASQRPLLPAEEFNVDNLLGGTDSEGIGGLVDGVISWRDQLITPRAGENNIVLSTPMEPGDYPLRIHLPGCPTEGVDFTISVALPPELPHTVFDPNGSESNVVSVTWLDDTTYAAVFRDSLGDDLLAVYDATNESLIDAVPCVDCGAYRSAAASPDGTLLAFGPELYRFEDHRLIHWTTFKRVAADAAYEQPFFVDNMTLSTVLLPNDVQGGLGNLVMIDLFTGYSTLFLSDTGVGIRQMADGLYHIGGMLYDGNTGAVVPTYNTPGVVGASLKVWFPTKNIGVMAGTGGNVGQLYQLFPAQHLADQYELCVMDFLNPIWITDPLELSATAFGTTVGFGTCGLNETNDAWTSHGGAETATGRVNDAAWSPSGLYLAKATPTGLSILQRE